MTLDETLLQKLSDWKPAGEGRQPLAFEDASTATSVRVQIERRDALSCQLWQVGVTRRAGEADLTAWAKRMADRVTGLLEPLSLHEVDAARGVAVLRSEAPAAKNDDRFYYELTLHRTGETHLRRWKGSSKPVPRQQVAFTLTNEALAKLAADLGTGV
jgi:hypothetical protein